MRTRTGIPLIASACLLASCSVGRSPVVTSGGSQMVAGSVSFAKPEISSQDKIDIYEAVVRYRLRKRPLGSGSQLYVHINSGAPTGLAARLREFKAIVRPGSQGNSPPPGRVFFIMLGKAAGARASLYVEDGREGLFIDVAKLGDRWVVVGERPAIIT